MIELRAEAVDAAPARDAPTVLRAATLALRGGESVAVMGASGAGKSTLALMLAGLAHVRAGRVVISQGTRIACSLQQPERALFGETVADDIAFVHDLVQARTGGRAGSGRDVSATGRSAAAPSGDADRGAIVTHALAQLGLDPALADRDPLALSGGERRRVAIASAFVPPPDIAILDEPTAGLDTAARVALHAALATWRTSARALVVVTHDPTEAAALCERLIVLAAGQIVYDGPLTSVLGRAPVATRLGLPVSAAVRVAHRVAVAHRRVAPVTVDERELVAFLASATGTRP